MEFASVVKNRRSIRKFKNKQVPIELLMEIIETCAFVPSWKNTQIARYNVVQNTDKIKEISQKALMGGEHNMGILEGTPCLVVLSYVKNRCGFERDGSYTTSKEGSWQMFDAGIAAQTFVLACHDRGLGSVIMGIFDDEKAAEAIELDEGETVAALIAVGYADEEPDVPKKKDVETLLRVIE